jgi:hypothetical protein
MPETHDTSKLLTVNINLKGKLLWLRSHDGTNVPAIALTLDPAKAARLMVANQRTISIRPEDLSLKLQVDSELTQLRWGRFLILLGLQGLIAALTLLQSFMSG